MEYKMALDNIGLWNTDFTSFKFDTTKRIVMCGVPGAFTPGCTNKHLPGFVEGIDDLYKVGIDQTVFMSVNDGCVMEAWGKHHGSSEITFVSDPLALWSTANKFDHDYGETMGVRCRRFAVLIENGKIIKEFKNPYINGVLAEL
jgi:2-Cys peroxiredoxin 5|tara:strand:- start:201 stop:632 length:432 start_codon:yes stop_codon:yes gene_type:complete